MPLTTAYLMQVKNLNDILEAIKSAQAPDKFTIKFLENLGFTSTNDRSIINVLKGLGFLDDNSVPKQRYFDFLDQNNSQRILADGIREAYADLFRINNKAYDLKHEDVKGKLKTLLHGSKSEQVLDKMARTFTSLCALADFSKHSTAMMHNKPSSNKLPPHQPKATTADVEVSKKVISHTKDLNLKYTINIELPTTRDQLVYNAIFKSIRENLL